MIAYIKGKLIENAEDWVVVETAGGVGYKVFVAGGFSENKNVAGDIGQDEVVFHTSHIIRENEQRIFGFQTKEERDFFELLITVSGVGPKHAMSLLSGMDWKELAALIVGGDSSGFRKVPGVGKKTIERLIVELRDKVERMGLDLGSVGKVGAGRKKSSERSKLLYDALSELGFAGKEIEAMIQSAGDKLTDDLNDEDALRIVLQHTRRG